MLTAGDALAKNFAKSQKVTFGSQNLALDADNFGSLLGAKIWLWMLIILDDCWRCSKSVSKSKFDLRRHWERVKNLVRKVL